MKQLFSDNMLHIADSMGISLYQRFSMNEASLFLHCSENDVRQMLVQEKIDYIQVTENNIEFFGYQLLQYLLKSVSGNIVTASNNSTPERIIRSKGVLDMTGLSRTTIWRLERKGDFPARVTLGLNSVGWRYNEVNNWVLNRQAK